MIGRIGSAVVVGAGTMGSQIACLLAGAGVRVRLFDMTDAVARSGLDRVSKLKPSPLYAPEHLLAIRTGGLDTEGALEAAVADADWVLEAIVEQLEPKRALFERVDPALTDRVRIVSTNTSGLSIGTLAEGRSEGFRRRFCGTHFFNPPRYTRLLELIPLRDTDPAVVELLADFGSRHLGKGTVVARDTPAFIANRLGVHGLMVALRLAQELGLGPDEVDELTGPLIGRPKSATFRTLDLVGVDVAAAVADHCRADLPDDPERDSFEVPPIMRQLLERGALGEKTGAGFFRKEGGEILALDLQTGEYRPRRRVTSAAVQLARNETDLAARVRALIGAQDTAGEFLRRALAANLGYAVRVGPQIAAGMADIDDAMRWGFGWELGPFQLLDALGPDATRLLPELERPSPAYQNGSSHSFVTGSLEPRPPRPGSLDLAVARRKELPSNAAATTLELGEGILGLELHGKLNIIGLDTIAMLERAVALASDRYDGLVIGTQAADFSAGANLALLLLEAEEGEWQELDRVVRRFQSAAMALRHAPIPVVVAPRGRTLGGGAELVLAADHAQALAETYIGLVELGVGLIPAGGGSTAMARRIAERLPDGARGDLFPLYGHVFTAVASATVATGAFEARRYLFLTDADAITADPDRQWADAARTARTLAENVAAQYGVSREDQDAWGLRSHQRASAAQREGRFTDEVVPVPVRVTEVDADGRPSVRNTTFEQDEGIRHDADAGQMAGLRPVFAAGGSVTAGNSSQMSDGAAALVVMTGERAAALGLTPLGRLVSFATAGVDPAIMGVGPVEAVPKALAKAGLALDDIAATEFNEAFAAQVVAVVRELGLDEATTNVNGGAIALGHPLGATGAKLTVQLLSELARRDGRYGLVTMCVGGGQGAAGVIEWLGGRQPARSASAQTDAPAKPQEAEAAA